MALTPPPIAPHTSDPVSFAARMDARLAWQDVNVAEMTALQADVATKQTAATQAAADAAAQLVLTTTQTGLASAQAALAAASAASAAATAAASAWVSGQAYALNVCAISQIDFQTYRRIVAGAGAVDPKNDTDNWVKVVALFYNVKAVVTASNFDIKAGDFFTRTISTATTFTVSNVPPDGSVVSFIVDMTNGGAFAITWWSGVKWAGGAAPALTATGRDVLGFFTHDAGVTWTGLLLAKDVK